jgi:hypothetical protein
MTGTRFLRKRGSRMGSCALALLVLTTPARLTAQQLFVAVEPRPALPPQLAVDLRPTGRLVAGGLAGGAVGALAGGLIAGGLRFLGPCDDQDGCIDRYADWAHTRQSGPPDGCHARGRAGAGTGDVHRHRARDEPAPGWQVGGGDWVEDDFRTYLRCGALACRLTAEALERSRCLLHIPALVGLAWRAPEYG